jgi:pyruvate/2-oxoglutarate dehydrogenase complex dihydrolipoamide dehydrogenase (E3) component
MGRVLARADAEHAAIAADVLRGEGVTLLEGHKAVRVAAASGAVTVHVRKGDQDSSLTGSHLLVALGRKPVLDTLDLDLGDVTTDEKGVVTKPSLRSVSNPRVWALGDAAGQGQFTHLAGWHASVFVQRAFFKLGTRADSQPLPSVTYTAPEVAQIGLTEAEAREKHGKSVTVSRFAFHENDRAIAEGKTEGEVKLVHLKGRVLVGASIIGESAGDLLQMISLAMAHQLTLRDLTSHMSPYPTRAEAVKRAASSHFTPLLFSGRTRALVGLLQRIP